MQERYRKDYDGEMVVTNVKQVGGQKEFTREWIDNPLELESISGRATCITKGPSIENFHIKRLSNHKGGLLGTLALHVYAVDDLYKQFTPNFLTTFSDDILKDIVANNLAEEIITYTSTKQCLQHPGEFYIIPYGFKTIPEIVNLWLACFDGHNEVFMFGYDETNDNGTRRDKMILGALDVMQTYSDIKFYWVVKQGEMPKEWRYLRNIKQMTVNEYVSYCDIS